MWSKDAVDTLRTGMADPALITQTAFTCIACGYNLSGTAIGGTCPECGKPVAESLIPVGRKADRQVVFGWTKRLGRTSGLTLLCLVSGPFSVAFYRIAKEERAAGRIGDLGFRFVEASTVLSLMALATGIIAFISMMGSP